MNRGVLFDEDMPLLLKKHLRPHNIKVFPVVKMPGWRGLENGELLDAAAAHPEIDVVLTKDKNIRHQQNIHKLPLPVIELSPDYQRGETDDGLMPDVLKLLQRNLANQFYSVGKGTKRPGKSQRRSPTP